jgi:hypothetical protein
MMQLTVGPTIVLLDNLEVNLSGLGESKYIIYWRYLGKLLLRAVAACCWLLCGHLCWGLFGRHPPPPFSPSSMLPGARLCPRLVALCSSWLLEKPPLLLS